MDNMANAKAEDVLKHMKKCGILSPAQDLIDMAKVIKEKYGGVVPSQIEDLEAFFGVGRKTALLMLTEIFGCYRGIPSDKHVIQGVLAYNLVGDSKKNKLDDLRAEASLRAWVPGHNLKEVNRIFGSFAQMFTQILWSPEAVRKDMLGERVVEAMVDYLHRPHHLATIRVSIVAVRRHYRANPKLLKD